MQGDKRNPALDPLEAAQHWMEQGHEVVLATVVRTWGSAPRPVGAHLAINQNGDFVGSVSGGCVEGAVIAESLDVFGSGEPKTLSFDVDNEIAWSVGLSCGGKIDIYMERVG